MEEGFQVFCGGTCHRVLRVKSQCSPNPARQQHEALNEYIPADGCLLEAACPSISHSLPMATFSAALL